MGWDSREPEAYRVAAHSLQQHASGPVRILPLRQQHLRDRGLYTREYRVNSSGQCFDTLDGKAFSTEFSFTRFLVPELMRLENIEEALFVDCDWLFLGDIYELFAQGTKPLNVIKHDYVPKSSLKMDGKIQSTYGRKLWSSLMLFKGPLDLVPKLVNCSTGEYLHGLTWAGSDIGALSEEWGWIPGVSPTTHVCNMETQPVPKGIHFTEGGPWFENYRTVEFASLWLKELKDSYVGSN